VKTTRFSISIEEELLKRFDRFIRRKRYKKRSKAVRDIIREKLAEEEWEKNEEVTGSLTLLYNHHIRGLSEEITDLQHHYNDVILATTHIHLDEENCLEVSLLRGSASKLQKLSDILISKRGVKLGKLTICSTGKKLGSQ